MVRKKEENNHILNHQGEKRKRKITSPLEKSKTKHKIKENRNLMSKLYFNSNSLYKKVLREKGYISQLKLYNLL